MLSNANLTRLRSLVRRLFVHFAAGLLVAPAIALAQVPAEVLLLVAAPQLRDPFFAKSVVLVTRHGHSPPLGVILNHGLRVRDSSGGVQTINVGGPVATDRYAFLFSSKVAPAAGNKVLKLSEQWYFGIASEDPNAQLPAPGEGEHRVFRGYASWDKGQLEHEIRRGDWLLHPFDPRAILHEDGEALWRELLREASRRTI